MAVPAKTVMTLRVPRELAERIRALAAREQESESVILRGLLRRGLELEQRSAKGIAR